MAVQSWFKDDVDDDPRLPHHRNPKEFVSLDKLAELGVLYWKLNPSDYENDEGLRKIREERGYNYMLMRVFKGKPVWTCYNRPQEDHLARKEYLKSFVNTAVPLEAH